LRDYCKRCSLRIALSKSRQGSQQCAGEIVVEANPEQTELYGGAFFPDSSPGESGNRAGRWKSKIAFPAPCTGLQSGSHQDILGISHVRRTHMVRVRKWGNSLGIRIPKVFAERLGLAEGTEVDFELWEGKLLVKKVSTLETLLAEVTPENLHQEVDTGKPWGREAW
jgi:antitoxin MazE